MLHVSKIFGFSWCGTQNFKIIEVPKSKNLRNLQPLATTEKFSGKRCGSANPSPEARTRTRKREKFSRFPISGYNVAKLAISLNNYSIYKEYVRFSMNFRQKSRYFTLALAKVDGPRPIFALEHLSVCGGISPPSRPCTQGRSWGGGAKGGSAP